MAINFDHTTDTISATGGGGVNVTNIGISEVDSISFADNGSNSQVWLIEEDSVSPTNALVFDYNNVERIRITPTGDIQLTGSFLDASGNEVIIPVATGSAVNEITITNAATGNGPEISATGDDTNVDLLITPKGTGSLIFDGLIWPSVDGTDGQSLTTDGSGNLTFTTISGGGGTVATVQTTDATVTTLASISLASGSTVTVRGFGMAQGPSQASVGFNFTGCGHNAAGTSVRDGRVVDTMDDNTNNYALDIDVDDASDTMRIRVTGIAATTIDWRVEYETTEEA